MKDGTQGLKKSFEGMKAGSGEAERLSRGGGGCGRICEGVGGGGVRPPVEGLKLFSSFLPCGVGYVPKHLKFGGCVLSSADTSHLLEENSKTSLQRQFAGENSLRDE
ncbi:hypothetical protein RUM44_000660 [Polyplax serrata]|uniref:Uncharacterized protein n=1 Tax=Polyplax serrata TaxID=468196 RepID=A0ABR1B8A5_POLSC